MGELTVAREAEDHGVVEDWPGRRLLYSSGTHLGYIEERVKLTKALTGL